MLPLTEHMELNQHSRGTSAPRGDSTQSLQVRVMLGNNDPEARWGGSTGQTKNERAPHVLRHQLDEAMRLYRYGLLDRSPDMEKAICAFSGPNFKVQLPTYGTTLLRWFKQVMVLYPAIYNRRERLRDDPHDERR